MPRGAARGVARARSTHTRTHALMAQQMRRVIRCHEEKTWTPPTHLYLWMDGVGGDGGGGGAGFGGELLVAAAPQ